MTINNICIYNLFQAIYNIRLSYNSLYNFDSIILNQLKDKNYISLNHIVLGENDKSLIKKLINNPSERKFLRQIFVSLNIKAPLYWWKQFDTYKIGVTTNSESTMHNLLKRKLTQNDFENPIESLILELLNIFISNKDFKNTNNNLPHSFLQERHITCNYEVLKNIYKNRKNHKLNEWKILCKNIEILPYFDLLIKE